MSKVAKVTLFAMVQQYLRYQNRERWFRRVVSKRRVERTSGFFDSYPEFFSSSTIALPDRINQRYRALIEWNSDILAGLRVLDLASHDGRWSFAAYKAGAKYVLGIEARPHLVDAARRNLLKYQVEEGRVEFVPG